MRLLILGSYLFSCVALCPRKFKLNFFSLLPLAVLTWCFLALPLHPPKIIARGSWKHVRGGVHYRVKSIHPSLPTNTENSGGEMRQFSVIFNPRLVIYLRAGWTRSKSNSKVFSGHQAKRDACKMALPKWTSLRKQKLQSRKQVIIIKGP